jgi:hypothetical protein
MPLVSRVSRPSGSLRPPPVEERLSIPDPASCLPKSFGAPLQFKPLRGSANETADNGGASRRASLASSRSAPLAGAVCRGARPPPVFSTRKRATFEGYRATNSTGSGAQARRGTRPWPGRAAPSFSRKPDSEGDNRQKNRARAVRSGSGPRRLQRKICAETPFTAGPRTSIGTGDRRINLRAHIPDKNCSESWDSRIWCGRCARAGGSGRCLPAGDFRISRPALTVLGALATTSAQKMRRWCCPGAAHGRSCTLT